MKEYAKYREDEYIVAGFIKPKQAKVQDDQVYTETWNPARLRLLLLLNVITELVAKRGRLQNNVSPKNGATIFQY